MQLTKTYEANGAHHEEITVSCEVNSREDIDALDYEDFEISLHIKGAYITNLAPLLSEMDLLKKLIDQTNWHELYQDVKAA